MRRSKSKCWGPTQPQVPADRDQASVIAVATVHPAMPLRSCRKGEERGGGREGEREREDGEEKMIEGEEGERKRRIEGEEGER